jgi:hypothetical protein
MQRHMWLAVAVLVVGGGLSFSQSPVTASAEAGDQSGATSTLDDQNELAITVYNSDLALVRDVRTVRVPRGEFDLRFMDIAATVNPATVHLRSLSEPANLEILEQNYEHDLLEPDKILRKYVGREVVLVRPRQESGTTVSEEVRATLLSYNEAPVWRIGNEIVTGLHPDHIRFPELPGNLYVRPTLIWSLDNRGGTEHRVQASYLATALKWNADYVLTVARDDKTADIDGWVTLTNNSGTEFRNAKLQLVAGDLNRVKEAMRRDMVAVMAASPMVKEARMAQETFSDYHLYTLERKTTISNKETKQLNMLTATGFPVRKRYVVDGQSYYYRNRQSPGSPLRDQVSVYYQLKNDETSGLGLPMPAGIVRVYQADSQGNTQFVGEDRIEHTPKDETLNLRIGTAFDVVAERKQTDFLKIADTVYEMEFELVLRNHKTTAITVDVNEPLGGTWRMLRSSHEWTKPNAWAAQFNVPVPAGGAATLTYRVSVTY